MRMGRPKKHPDELLSETIPIRFTKKEKDVLCVLAGNRCSINRLIRRQLAPLFAQIKINPPQTRV